MKKLISLVVALAMCLASLGALAEEKTMNVVSVGNVSFSAPGGVSGNVGASVTARCGMGEDGRRIGIFSLESAQGEIARLTLALEGVNAKAYLDGMSSAYEVNLKELARSQMSDDGDALTLEEFINSQMPADDTLSAMDTEALREMVEGYIGLMKSANQNQDEAKRAVMDVLGVDMESAPVEEVEVLGEKMNLRRLEMTLTPDQYDAMYAALGEVNEDFAKFWKGYMAILTKAAGLEEGASFSEVLEKMGASFEIPMTLWTDEENKDARAELIVQMTVQGEDGPQSVSFPYTVEAHQDDHSIKMALDMDMSEIGGAMHMDLDGAKEETGAHLNCNASVTANGEDASLSFAGAITPLGENANLLHGTLTASEKEQEVTLSIDGLSSVSEEGACMQTLTLVGGADDETGALTLNYSGREVQEDGFSGQEGHLDLTGSFGGQTFSCGFDLRNGKEPMGDAFAEIDGKNVVSLTESRDEDTLQKAQQKALGELQTVGIRMVGALMQVPGVAELITTASGAMNANEDTYDEYDEYEDAYVDYGDDGADDFAEEDDAEDDDAQDGEESGYVESNVQVQNPLKPRANNTRSVTRPNSGH